MLRRLLSVAAGGFAGLVATSASAQTILFANGNNQSENPPAVPTLQNGQPRPASFGTALFILNAAQTEMTMDTTVFNIDFTGSQTPDPNDNLTAAHIHAGPNVTPTTNGGVVWGFFGSPQNTPDDVVVTPFATGVGGNITATWDAAEGNNTTLAAQLTHLLNNRAYINFHTVQFGGGEVRGNIAVVPEPSAVALLGAAGLLALRRRA
jgi:hypothetical protein